MKNLWLIIIIAAFAPMGWSQSIPISGQVFNQYGSPVAGAQVYICSAAGSTGLPCTPPATIYQDYNLTTTTPNPTQTDANGNFSVYVGALAFPNTYVVNMATGSGPIYTQLYPGPSCPLSGCTFVGPVTATLFNATTSPYFEVNGTQLASTNLLDTANIAYKNAANTFTGNPQTAPVWNATTGFDVNGTPLASTNLSDSANLARLNASNTFTGATNTFAAIVGTTINATTGFDVNGTPLSASNLSNGVSGTGAVCLASGSACAGSAPFAGAGIPYATSTTASTVATSPQLVSALNNTPSTTLATALLPEATNSTFGTVKPDNTSITISGGVISSNGIASVTRKNCLSVSCAGGSTYASGTTYTNISGVPVFEEVTISGPGEGSAGCDYQLATAVGGAAGPYASITNDSWGYQSVAFIVGSGITFSATASQISGGSGCGVFPGIVTWHETTL